MKEIVFLSVQQVCNIQKVTLPGVPSGNIGLLEGAINRVINQHHYNGTSDIFELAAMYLVAIAKAHAFPDANKRSAFQSACRLTESSAIISIFFMLLKLLTPV